MVTLNQPVKIAQIIVLDELAGIIGIVAETVNGNALEADAFLLHIGYRPIYCLAVR